MQIWEKLQVLFGSVYEDGNEPNMFISTFKVNKRTEEGEIRIQLKGTERVQGDRKRVKE